VLAPYRVMVRPLVGGVSKALELKLPPKLDADEIEGGTQAFSALLYQYGGALDARVLVAMWVAGVTLPRVLMLMEEKKRAQPSHSPSKLAADIDAELAAANAASLERAVPIKAANG